VEVTPLIGADRAEEIVQALLAEDFLETPTTPAKPTAAQPVQPAANGLMPVGCTHPTTPSSPREVY
jgi:hypothetical protein